MDGSQRGRDFLSLTSILPAVCPSALFLLARVTLREHPSCPSSRPRGKRLLYGQRGDERWNRIPKRPATRIPRPSTSAGQRLRSLPAGLNSPEVSTVDRSCSVSSVFMLSPS